jgi:hypothetical protein
MIQQIRDKNPILFWLGGVHFTLFALLLAFFPFNDTLVLGINSVIKPMKFALSIGVFSWSMALILQFVNNIRKVKIYSWAAVICLGFEQFAITLQALRGAQSHFNKTDAFGIVLYALMGVFILTITLWTGFMTYIFIKQKAYNMPLAVSLGIKIGLIYCVIFSLFGGYVSGLTGHTVGAADGGSGLPFLNWSRFFGDLRVAHFFGIHSLQILPLFAIFIEREVKTSVSIKAVWLFALVYLAFVVFTMIQGLKGIPFIHF